MAESDEIESVLIVVRCIGLGLSSKTVFQSAGMISNLLMRATGPPVAKNEKCFINISQSEPFKTAGVHLNLNYPLIYQSETFEDLTDLTPSLVAEIKCPKKLDCKLRLNVYYSSNLTSGKEEMLAAASFSKKELIRSVTTHGVLSVEMSSKYCVGAKLYVEIVQPLPDLFAENIFPILSAPNEFNPLLQRYVFYNEFDNLMPMLYSEERTVEPKFTAHIPYLFLRNFANAVLRSIFAWSLRAELERMRQGRFTSLDEAYDYGWHCVTITVVAARVGKSKAQTDRVRQYQTNVKNAIQTNPSGGHNSIHLPCYQVFVPMVNEPNVDVDGAYNQPVSGSSPEGGVLSSEGLAPRTNSGGSMNGPGGGSRVSSTAGVNGGGFKNLLNVGSGGKRVDDTCPSSFVEIHLEDRSQVFMQPIGRTNTEYFTMEPVYGSNINLPSGKKGNSQAEAADETVQLFHTNKEFSFYSFLTNDRELSSRLELEDRALNPTHNSLDRNNSSIDRRHTSSTQRRSGTKSVVTPSSQIFNTEERTLSDSAAVEGSGNVNPSLSDDAKVDRSVTASSSTVGGGAMLKEGGMVKVMGKESHFSAYIPSCDQLSARLDFCVEDLAGTGHRIGTCRVPLQPASTQDVWLPARILETRSISQEKTPREDTGDESPSGKRRTGPSFARKSGFHGIPQFEDIEVRVIVSVSSPPVFNHRAASTDQEGETSVDKATFEPLVPAAMSETYSYQRGIDGVPISHLPPADELQDGSGKDAYMGGSVYSDYRSAIADSYEWMWYLGYLGQDPLLLEEEDQRNWTRQQAARKRRLTKTNINFNPVSSTSTPDTRVSETRKTSEDTIGREVTEEVVTRPMTPRFDQDSGSNTPVNQNLLPDSDDEEEGETGFGGHFNGEEEDVIPENENQNEIGLVVGESEFPSLHDINGDIVEFKHISGSDSDDEHHGDSHHDPNHIGSNSGIQRVNSENSLDYFASAEGGNQETGETRDSALGLVKPEETYETRLSERLSSFVFSGSPLSNRKRNSSMGSVRSNYSLVSGKKRNYLVRPRIDFSYPVPWILSHVDELKSLLDQLHTVLPEMRKMVVLDRSFRRSPLKKELEVQAVPINLHFQMMGVRQYQSTTSKASPYHTEVMSCVTCGSLSPHMLGHKHGGLFIQETQLGRDKEDLTRAKSLFARAVQDAGDLCIPVGVAGTMAHVDKMERNFSTPFKLLHNVGKKLQQYESKCLHVGKRKLFAVSQSLSVAVNGLLMKMSLAINDKVDKNLADLELWLNEGFLIVFEGLLSVINHERSMLEDTISAVDSLRHYQVKLLLGSNRETEENKSKNPEDLSNRGFFSLSQGSPKPSSSDKTLGLDPDFLDIDMEGREVQVFISLKAYEKLPESYKEKIKRDGVVIPFFPVLFTQGIDIQQTMATKFGGDVKFTGAHQMKSVDLQYYVNRRAFTRLNAYSIRSQPVNDFASDSAKYRNIPKPETQTEKPIIPDTNLNPNFPPPSLESPRPARVVTEEYLTDNIHPLLSTLNQLITPSTVATKNVDLLIEVERVGLMLGGCRVTFCKSGKDRTSMACTLEQSRQLGERFGCGEKLPRVLRDANLMRLRGCRIKVAEKNIGRPIYSINKFQAQFLPLVYRPPNQVLEDLMKKDSS